MKVVAFYHGDQRASQKNEVKLYCQANRAKLVDEVTEKRGNDWSGLREAVWIAQQRRATLVIARYLGTANKSREALNIIHECQLAFRFLDYPEVNRVALRAIVMTEEIKSRGLSEKIKEGFAKSDKKKKLGFADKKNAKNRNTTTLAAAGSKRRTQIAEAAYLPLVPEVKKLHIDGWSFDRIAAHLNAQGHCTTRGKPFVGAKLCIMFQKIEGRKPTKRKPLDPEIEQKILRMDSKGMDSGKIADWLNERKVLTTTGKEWDCETAWRVIRQLKGLPRKLQPGERKA